MTNNHISVKRYWFVS